MSVTLLQGQFVSNFILVPISDFKDAMINWINAFILWTKIQFLAKCFYSEMIKYN